MQLSLGDEATAAQTHGITVEEERTRRWMLARAATVVSPENAEAWNVRGVYLTNAPAGQEALTKRDCYGTAVRLNPQSGVMVSNLGYFMDFTNPDDVTQMIGLMNGLPLNQVERVLHNTGRDPTIVLMRKAGGDAAAAADAFLVGVEGRLDEEIDFGASLIYNHNIRGVVRNLRGNRDGAVQDWVEVLRQDRTQRFAVARLGEAGEDASTPEAIDALITRIPAPTQGAAPVQAPPGPVDVAGILANTARTPGDTDALINELVARWGTFDEGLKDIPIPSLGVDPGLRGNLLGVLGHRITEIEAQGYPGPRRIEAVAVAEMLEKIDPTNWAGTKSAVDDQYAI
ncbi:Uncharacterised protein [uncultured archaeon]|nr:Uncharacterised protein [uncultured archaeon]